MQFVRKMVVMGAILASLGIGLPALAQTADQTPQATSSSPAPVPDQGTLKPAELEGLVAPIALYPDTLLSNVLMASTYPLEVVHAARWLNQNKDLKGDALKAGAEKQEWDASVKALIATPSVLQMMNEHLEWTQKLGEAFLAQQQDVMDAVQRLRSKAYDRKKLVTTNEQKVTVREDQNRQFIYIEPAAPDSIYVPYYEPQVVFGDWPYSDLSGIPLLLGLPRLHRSRPDRNRRGVQRRLRTRTMGNGRLLGKRRMVGRQSRQLGRRSDRHQPRGACRALAPRHKAPPRCTLQQLEPSAEIRQRQSPPRRSARIGKCRQSSECRQPRAARGALATSRPQPSGKPAGGSQQKCWQSTGPQSLHRRQTRALRESCCASRRVAGWPFQAGRRPGWCSEVRGRRTPGSSIPECRWRPEFSRRRRRVPWRRRPRWRRTWRRAPVGHQLEARRRASRSSRQRYRLLPLCVQRQR
ncbi:hypothetical protein ACVW16_002320 [Bradyrhizobium sp. USDA 4474]